MGTKNTISSSRSFDIQLRGIPSQQVTIQRHQYGNKRIAIVLLCMDGSRFAVATVNLPDTLITAEEVAVKDYSENEGMLQFLLNNGIVDQPHRFEYSGHVEIPICRLKVRFA